MANTSRPLLLFCPLLPWKRHLLSCYRKKTCIFPHEKTVTGKRKKQKTGLAIFDFRTVIYYLLYLYLPWTLLANVRGSMNGKCKRFEKRRLVCFNFPVWLTLERNDVTSPSWTKCTHVDNTKHVSLHNKPKKRASQMSEMIICNYNIKSKTMKHIKKH